MSHHGHRHTLTSHHHRHHQHEQHNVNHPGHVLPHSSQHDGRMKSPQVQTAPIPRPNSDNKMVHHYPHAMNEHVMKHNHQSIHRHHHPEYQSYPHPKTTTTARINNGISYIHQQQTPHYSHQATSTHRTSLIGQNIVQPHCQHVSIQPPNQPINRHVTMQPPCQICQPFHCPQCEESRFQNSNHQMMQVRQTICPECERAASGKSTPVLLRRVSSHSHTAKTPMSSRQPAWPHQPIETEKDVAFSTGGQQQTHHVFSSVPHQTPVLREPMDIDDDVSFSTGGQSQAYHLHERESVNMVDSNLYSRQMSFVPASQTMGPPGRDGFNVKQPTIAIRRMMSKQVTRGNQSGSYPIQSNSLQTDQNYLTNGSASQLHVTSQPMRQESIRGVTLIAAPMNGISKTYSNGRMF